MMRGNAACPLCCCRSHRYRASGGRGASSPSSSPSSLPRPSSSSSSSAALTAPRRVRYAPSVASFAEAVESAPKLKLSGASRRGKCPPRCSSAAAPASVSELKSTGRIPTRKLRNWAGPTLKVTHAHAASSSDGGTVGGGGGPRSSSDSAVRVWQSARESTPPLELRVSPRRGCSRATHARNAMGTMTLPGALSLSPSPPSAAVELISTMAPVATAASSTPWL